MGKSTVAAQSFLQLIFTAVAWADLAEDDSTSPAANITVALHTADPGISGTQLTNEAAYTSYTRISVVRTSSGWNATTTPGTATPVADIEFPTATGGSETITHWSIGSGVSNYMIASGTVTPNIAVSSGVQPKLTTASTIVES